MKTASWFTHSGPGRIAVCRAAPRRTAAGFRLFKALAPGPWFNSVSREEYERRYHAEVLKRLNPRDVQHQLLELAAGHEPVLMCFERPPFHAANWCHRRTLIAPWLEQAIGEAVHEHDARPRNPPPDRLDDITPYIGREATADGITYRVIGPSSENPGQAIVETSTGYTFPAGLEALKRRFG